MNVLEAKYLGNPLEAWMSAVATFAIALLALVILKKYVILRISAFLSAHGMRGGGATARIAEATRTAVLFSGALYAALQFLSLPPRTTVLLDRALFIVFVIQLTLWGNLVLSLYVEKYLGERISSDASKATSIHALLFVARTALLAVMVLWTLDNLGVNITTLVAGLGVGGVAVALAVQNILGDLFASFTIVLDKPFVIGDSIVIGDFSGTVEHVGIKTTRLRSVGGEQLIFANADLLQSRIRNFKRMIERRIVFTISVTYETTPAQLRKIPDIIREAIQKQGRARFDRSHFKTFSPASLDFESVYFVLSPEMKDSMDVQQAINLELVDRFALEKIKFASPTPPVVIQNTQKLKSVEEVPG